MHKHPRARIRKKFISFVKNGVNINKIFENRPSPYMLEELPCISIYFQNENAEFENTAPPSSERSLTISIESIFKPSSIAKQEVVDDWFDDRAYEIEYSILSRHINDWDTFENEHLVDKIYLSNTTPYSLTHDGRKIAESNKLDFIIIYKYPEYNENNKLNEFLRFNTEYDVNNKSISDKVTIREG